MNTLQKAGLVLLLLGILLPFLGWSIPGFASLAFPSASTNVVNFLSVLGAVLYAVGAVSRR